MVKGCGQSRLSFEEAEWQAKSSSNQAREQVGELGEEAARETALAEELARWLELAGQVWLAAARSEWQPTTVGTEDVSFPKL